MLDQITRETFAEHVGSRFRVAAGAGQTLPGLTPSGSTTEVEIELIEAQLLPVHAGKGGKAPKRQPFSLTFRGPGYLPQKIYRLEHAKLGALEMFLVPLGPDDKGMRFEAIFT